jgi:hypothetical protein
VRRARSPPLELRTQRVRACVRRCECNADPRENEDASPMKCSRPLFRWVRYILGALLIILCLYALSFGLASAWVASAILDQEPTQLNIACYDARLHSFKRFYAPIIEFRNRLNWTVSPRIEDCCLTYDGWFARPRRVADGREVTTVAAFHPLHPGETAAHYIQYSLGFGDSVVPKPGTQLFDLPKNNRILVVYAAGGDDDTSSSLPPWHGAWPTMYADLCLPAKSK